MNCGIEKEVSKVAFLLNDGVNENDGSLAGFDTMEIIVEGNPPKAGRFMRSFWYIVLLFDSKHAKRSFDCVTSDSETPCDRLKNLVRRGGMFEVF